MSHCLKVYFDSDARRVDAARGSVRLSVGHLAQVLINLGE